MLGLGNELPRAFGPYTLIRQLAVGGMAEIYLAKAKGIGGFEKLLAMKMIHPRFSEDDHFITMLIEEAKISVQLNHVNIGQIFDLGRIEGTYYIAMEYIEGADVYRAMRRASEMGVDIPIDTAVYVTQEICAGLDYAHRKRDGEGKPLKIIHRDISPQNVIISFAGEVKIVDFGIAKASLRAKETEVGVIKGKYYYMSPEQAWGDPIDARTDIFSTGIILYEMLTGQMLYMEDNVPALLDRVRKADIAPPSSRRAEIPPALDEIVMRTLAKYPDDRFATAHDLQTALTRFLFSFSPDYTASMLAGLVSWLFEDEAKRPSIVESSKAAAVPVEPTPAPTPTPVPVVTSKPGTMELMTGDELSEEAVSPSMIFSLADITSVRAAKAMAALRQEPPDERTLRQPGMMAEVLRAARQEEEEEETEVWGDETLIDREHKFREIAEQFRAAEAAKKQVAAPAAPVAPAEPDRKSQVPTPAPPKRSPDETTRPVEVSDAVVLVARRRVASVPPPAAPPPAPRIEPIVSRPPGPAQRSTATPPPAPPPPRPAGQRSGPKRTLMGMAIAPPPPPPRPAPPAALPPPPPAPPPIIGPHVAVGSDHITDPEIDPLAEAPTMAAQSPVVTFPPPPSPPPPEPRRSDASDSAMTQVATPALGPRRQTTGPVPTEKPAAPPARPVAPPPIASAQTKPILAPPATATAVQADQQTRSLVGATVPEPVTGPFVIHDPFTASYLAPPPSSGLPRIVLWIAAAVFAIGVVVATIVFVTPPDADPCVLEITSHPPGAQVRVGEVAVPGATPLRVEGLEAGRSYQLEVRLPGYQSWIQQFQASPGIVQQIAILDAVRGTIEIHTSPEGAQIYIDNVYRGSTPLTIPGLEINRALTVRAERRGFVTEERRHVWNGQTTALLRIDLRPLSR